VQTNEAGSTLLSKNSRYQRLKPRGGGGSIDKKCLESCLPSNNREGRKEGTSNCCLVGLDRTVGRSGKSPAILLLTDCFKLGTGFICSDLRVTSIRY
jgi:hypothetical protein